MTGPNEKNELSGKKVQPPKPMSNLHIDESGKVAVRGMNGGRRSAGKHQPSNVQGHGRKKTPAGWTVFYITGVSILVVLAATYFVYTSTHTDSPIYAVPSSEDQPGLVPVSSNQPAGTDVPPPLSVVVPDPIHVNAIINVPSVGLRNAPDITAKSISGRLKKGEGVEIVKRHESWGPEWVKVRTKSGKLGWVFASVIKEQKGS